jgi:tetratricopeptide (TPR) repeat protein
MKKWLFLVLFAGIKTLGFAASFDDGLKAANGKNYKKAIHEFEEVTKEEPRNSAAFYNLGNAYYKNKEFGKAIWAYETSIKLSPKNAEAPVNIELCYRELSNGNSWQPSISGVQRLIYGIGSTTWAVLSIILSCLIAYSIFSLLKHKNTPWKRFHVMALFGESILFIGFLIAANSSANYPENQDFGIVTSKTSPCYLNETAKTADFLINEGAKVLILSEKGNRIEVELIEGRKVFISKKDLRII